MMQLWKKVTKTPTVNQVVGRTTEIKSSINPKTKVQNLKPWKAIPGPRSFPFIGPSLNFLPGGILHNVSGYELIDKLYKRYGPIVRLDGAFGANDLIWLYDPESVKQVHQNEHDMPIRPGMVSFEYYRKNHKKENVDKSLPTGLVTDHGEMWKKFRLTVNPVLLQSPSIELYGPQLTQVAEDMVRRIRFLRDQNNKIEDKFDTEMNLWALESVGVVALGSRINCLDPNLPEDSPARKLIQCIHNIFKLADALDFMPSIWRYVPTKNFNRAMEVYKEHEDLSKYFITQAKEKLKSEGKVSDYEKGILEKLQEIDERTAYVMANDMLFAGIETVSITMIATLYLLAKNQDKQEKLRNEIFTKQTKKPYLKACLKESIRMMPAVSGNIRKTTKEHNILGYRIPKGTFVALSHQYMSMMESQYPRPDEYIPERWIVDRSDPMYHGNAHPFAYNPFGHGTRSCIGHRIADLEMQIFLEKMIENFHIEWSGAPPSITTTSLNYVTGPFHFVFKDI